MKIEQISNLVWVAKNISDERFVCDVIAPGFGKDDITVKSAKVDGGQKIKITVAGKYARNKNKAGTPVPRFGFEKVVDDFSVNIAGADGNFDFDKLNVEDYDLDKLTWSVKNGVVRISVPKTTLAKGTPVTAADNADADSSGDTTATTEDSSADAE